MWIANQDQVWICPPSPWRYHQAHRHARKYLKNNMRSVLEQGRLLSLILNLIFRVLIIIHDQISETFLPLDVPPGVCGWEPVVLAAHANPLLTGRIKLGNAPKQQNRRKIPILGALHLSRPCPLRPPPAARAPICAPDLRWSRGATSPNFPWNDTLRARAFSATCQNQNYWIRDDDLRKGR